MFFAQDDFRWVRCWDLYSFLKYQFSTCYLSFAKYIFSVNVELQVLKPIVMNLSTNIIVACCTRKLYVVRVVSQCTLCQWLMVLDVFCYQTLYTFCKFQRSVHDTIMVLSVSYFGIKLCLWWMFYHACTCNVFAGFQWRRVQWFCLCQNLVLCLTSVLISCVFVSLTC